MLGLYSGMRVELVEEYEDNRGIRALQIVKPVKQNRPHSRE
jgi:hypothetical protein